MTIATTWLKPLHVGKNRNLSTAIKDIIDYVDNPQKTENGKWITGYCCDSRVADAQFILTKNEYLHHTGRSQGKRDVIAYHTRQSFMPGEITPEEANRIGVELAMRFTKGKYAFVVCTHIDTSHIHNHIIINSTSLDCERKFRNYWNSSFGLRRLNDQLCLENGYSIIENPKPPEKHYGDWLGENRKPSFQNQIRSAIDKALTQNPADFDSFLRLMEQDGVSVNSRRKNITFKMPGQDRATRCNTLKGEYTEQAIRQRIAGGRMINSSGGGHVAQPQSVNLLIDIQEKILAGKGTGYVKWAKVFNVKEMAKTLISLQQRGLDDYEKLEKATEAATADFHKLSGELKSVETRLKEIATLQKHISSYQRTKETYVAYRKAGYSKNFRADHESEIILHQAAKKAFDDLGVKKLPAYSQLKQEYAALSAEKNKLYSSYRKAREEMKELQVAKANADKILGIPLTPQDKEKQR